MTLLKTSAINAMAVAVRILAAIGLNKVLALYVGPAGYAVVGQFTNIVTLIGAITGGVVSTGVTKYTAEFHDAEDRQRAVWRAASRYLLASTGSAVVAIVLFSEPLAAQLLGDASYRVALIGLGLTLPLLSINALLLAVMNGRKEIRGYVMQGIASTTLGALASAALAIGYGLRGALLAVVLNALLGTLVTVWVCRRSAWASLSSFIGPVASGTYQPLLGYAAMALTSAVAAPLSQVAVRDHLIGQFGQVAAGEWQAVFKISEIYIQLFTATLGLYYLPRLAEIRDPRQLWKEIGKVCGFVLPLAALAALTIYLLREWITVTLFTKAFLGMVGLFGWQLVGDVLKVGSWVFGFVLVGRAMVRWFIATEIIFGLTWVLLTRVLTGTMGLEGASAAFALNYAAYWSVVALLVWRESMKMKV
ncbi:MAG: O-antigen translocase [Thiobacillus sp.]